MPRREYIYTRHCKHEGCGESAHYRCSNQADYFKTSQQYNSQPWYCNRHDPNGENLQPASPERRIVNIYHADESEYPNLRGQCFWRKNDAPKVSSGFIYGDSWNAYGEDFPLGTIIEVTTTIRVILPTKSD